MDLRHTNSRDQQLRAIQPDLDWAALSPADRVRHLELEGYLLLPGMLDAATVAAVRQDLQRLPTRSTDYSEHQRGHRDVAATDSPAAIRVIGLPAMTAFLERLFGDALVVTSCTFSVSEPGHPGIAIHTDAQPYGSRIFGLAASSPVLVRCLYYLDDLPPLRSPLKVIPRSHLSMHRDGNPYNRFLRHPDERMVTARAGDCAIINQRIFHGNYPNYSDSPRQLLAVAYRPAWAGPLAELPEHDPAFLAKLPADVRALYRSPNTRDINFDVANRPDNLAEDAPGISPRRWET